jgi:antitoxin component YwqK of YwqJK toxin-antitoxin module
MYYPDGQLQRIAQVVNGKYVGVIRTYFNSGKLYELDSLISACDVSSGECDETLIRYSENGKLSQRFTVRAGHFNGLSQQFDQKGLLAKEYELVDDSIKNGVYREFYDNGKILRSATLHMDTLVGYEYIFKENGDTLKYYSHYQGQMDFPYKIWLEDGGTAYGVRLKGEMVLWTWYDKNGNILKRQTATPSKSGYVLPH